MGLILTDLGVVCALGTSKEEIICNACAGNTKGMFRKQVTVNNTSVPFGYVNISHTNKLRCFDLIDCALLQLKDTIYNLKQKYTSDRLGIVIGSSNTGIQEAQQIVNDTLVHNTTLPTEIITCIDLASPTKYIQEKIGFLGPCYTISTACSSSIKAFSSACKLLIENICDVVLVGGVDARCDFALNGFYSLSALSTKLTNPMSKNRDGINLGEGVALFILQKADNGISIKGIGENSDAYHLTKPDPSGEGAYYSMKQALEEANLLSTDIDFINMHGTGTEANDLMESKAIYKLFGNNVQCASTKPMTGHTLGAAGSISLALSWLMLQKQVTIPHIFDGELDDECSPIQLTNKSEHKELKNILCNAFAFGGSNTSIIIGK